MDANTLFDSNATITQPALQLSSIDINSLFSQVVSFVMQQFNTAVSLLQRNVLWIVAIAAITYVISEYALGRIWKHGGLLRHAVAFLIAMAISFLWVPLLSGVIR